jgi:hypothetical protein
MEFRRELQLTAFKEQINIKNKIMLCGSCFTENLGDKLAQMLFQVEMNPNGILFNPKSILNSINSYIENKQYQSTDFFLHNEVFYSWQHHSRFSNMDPETLANDINKTQSKAHYWLKSSDWLILTLGSSFVYELANGEAAANCHKMPTNYFSRRLMNSIEITQDFFELFNRLEAFNPKLRIILTISPVRHLRDGFIENNRSKAMLIQAVHQLEERFANVFYFPAYELVLDDLRDYRFYAEDMTHPNYLATQYVWEKFMSACIDKDSIGWMKEINTLNAAKAHKSFHPETNAHQLFLKKNLDKLTELKKQLPELNWNQLEKYFQEELHLI